MDISKASDTMKLLEQGFADPEFLLRNMNKDVLDLAKVISMDGMTVQKQLVQFLNQKFQDKDIRCESHGFTIDFYIPSMSTRNLFTGTDHVVHIDMLHKTYSLCVSVIRQYEKVMQEPVVQKTYEVSDWIKQFADLSTKGRLSSIGKRWHDKNLSLLTKVSDTWILLFRKSKLEAAMQIEQRRVEKKNEEYKAYYDREYASHMYFVEHTPEHITRFKEAGNEVISYFMGMNYTESKENLFL